MSHSVSGTHRRGFLGGMAAGAAALVVGRFSTAGAEILAASESRALDDAWIGKIKGKYRQVFDATAPNEGWGAAFPLSFIDSTKEAVKATDADITAITVFRHFAMPLMLNDADVGEVQNRRDAQGHRSENERAGGQEHLPRQRPAPARSDLRAGDGERRDLRGVQHGADGHQRHGGSWGWRQCRPGEERLHGRNHSGRLSRRVGRLCRQSRAAGWLHVLLRRLRSRCRTRVIESWRRSSLAA